MELQGGAAEVAATYAAGIKAKLSRARAGNCANLLGLFDDDDDDDDEDEDEDEDDEEVEVEGVAF